MISSVKCCVKLNLAAVYILLAKIYVYEYSYIPAHTIEDLTYQAGSEFLP